MKNSGYVIVEGNIGVGKSTFSALLAKALQDKGVRASPSPTCKPLVARSTSWPAYWSDDAPSGSTTGTSTATRPNSGSKHRKSRANCSPLTVTIGTSRHAHKGLGQ